MKNAVAVALILVVLTFSCQKQSPPKPPNKIPIKAAIIYNIGGAQAVARENFYLLKKDPLEIWREAGLTKDAKMKDERWFWVMFSIDRYYTREKESSKFEKPIKPYIVATTTTDFEGNASFENVPDGSYYIYGVTETRAGHAVWSHKVSTGDNQTVFLDNKNAVYSK